MNLDCQVLVWGGYFCDLIYSDLPGFPRLGKEIYSRAFELRPGGCFTTLLAFKRLGVQASWACDFGDDLFSQLVLEQARREGFDERLFRRHSFPVRRVTSVISFPHERAFLSFMDELQVPEPVHILQEVRAEWLLLSHLCYGAENLALFQAARRQGMKIFMDCQSIDTSLQETPQIAGALGLVDVFSPNEAEALQLTGESEVEGALDRLGSLAPVVVIKRGAAGALACRAGRRMRSPALQVGEPLDTTGAGDCFDAGFLYGQLKGYEIESTLRIANICGALSVQAAGGSQAPTEAEVLSRL